MSTYNQCKEEKERKLSFFSVETFETFFLKRNNSTKDVLAEKGNVEFYLTESRCRLSLNMQSSIWCAAVIFLVLLLAVLYGDGKSGISEKENSEDEIEEENRSEIPRHHRSDEAHSRHKRAERGRYRSVLAVGVGCAVAGGWICLATVVYVVRYIHAKRKAATMKTSDDDCL